MGLHRFVVKVDPHHLDITALTHQIIGASADTAHTQNRNISMQGHRQIMRRAAIFFKADKKTMETLVDGRGPAV